LRWKGRSDLVFTQAWQRYLDCAGVLDDIVFGGSFNSLVARFADDMSREFEMSMWVSCSSSLGYKSNNQRKEHPCTKLTTPRTL
jgi:hypothetical protein